jgi:hypothetical protein
MRESMDLTLSDIQAEVSLIQASSNLTETEAAIRTWIRQEAGECMLCRQQCTPGGGSLCPECRIKDDTQEVAIKQLQLIPLPAVYVGQKTIAVDAGQIAYDVLPAASNDRYIPPSTLAEEEMQTLRSEVRSPASADISGRPSTRSSVMLGWVGQEEKDATPNSSKRAEHANRDWTPDSKASGVQSSAVWTPYSRSEVRREDIGNGRRRADSTFIKGAKPAASNFDREQPRFPKTSTYQGRDKARRISEPAQGSQDPPLRVRRMETPRGRKEDKSRSSRSRGRK